MYIYDHTGFLHILQNLENNIHFPCPENVLEYFSKPGNVLGNNPPRTKSLLINIMPTEEKIVL